MSHEQRIVHKPSFKESITRLTRNFEQGMLSHSDEFEKADGGREISVKESSAYGIESYFDDCVAKDNHFIEHSRTPNQPMQKRSQGLFQQIS